MTRNVVCITRVYILRMVGPSGETSAISAHFLLDHNVPNLEIGCCIQQFRAARPRVQKHNGVLTGYVKLGKNNMCKICRDSNDGMKPLELLLFV